jgi:hypothetical protein
VLGVRGGLRAAQAIVLYDLGVEDAHLELDAAPDDESRAPLDHHPLLAAGTLLPVPGYGA